MQPGHIQTTTLNRVRVRISSGRSGGVIDDVVMDLAVGLGAPFQKNGAPRSGERIEKLNFLLRAAERIPTARSQTCRHWCGSESFVGR